jgi:hypothetical protein
VAVAVVVAIALSACTGGSPHDTSDSPVGYPTAAASTERSDPALRLVAVTRLLAARGAAVVHDDAHAYAATQTSSRRVPIFTRLAVLPVTAWSYSVQDVTGTAGADSVLARVRIAYRLVTDRADAVVRERLSLVHTAAGWRISSEVTDGDRREPWDLGTLTVVRGRSCVVIGIDTTARVLRSYAAVVDAVVPDVSAVWGTGWARREVLIVPRTRSQLSLALGRGASSLHEVAAVTVAGDRGDGPVPGADRVWTNTPLMSTLSRLGRGVVLRHETTHVATGAASNSATPLWLEEGIAEFVGYRGVGVPTAIAMTDLIRAERTRTPPAPLPTAADFAGARIAVAYESAHLASLVLAESYGVAGLVRVYRLTAGGNGTPDHNLDAALRHVTGAGTAALTARARARARALAA